MDAKMDACWGPQGRARGARNMVLEHPVLFEKNVEHAVFPGEYCYFLRVRPGVPGTPGNYKKSYISPRISYQNSIVRRKNKIVGQ